MLNNLYNKLLQIILFFYNTDKGATPINPLMVLYILY